MRFSTPRLTCLPLQESDKVNFCGLYTNVKVMRKIAKPLTENQAQHHFESALQKSSEDPFSRRTWTIRLTHNFHFVGIEALSWHHPISNEAEIGIMLNQASSAKGFPEEAMGGLVNIGFSHYGLTRINARFHPQNTPVERFVSKLGFTVNPQISEGQLGPMKTCYIEKHNWQYQDHAR